MVQVKSVGHVIQQPSAALPHLCAVPEEGAGEIKPVTKQLNNGFVVFSLNLENQIGRQRPIVLIVSFKMKKVHLQTPESLSHNRSRKSCFHLPSSQVFSTCSLCFTLLVLLVLWMDLNCTYCQWQSLRKKQEYQQFLLFLDVGGRSQRYLTLSGVPASS